ncbi:MAG: plastocyanin/azurin family copper-binding protein [Planctomycetota bacterium]|jgi:plastocyanin
MNLLRLSLLPALFALTAGTALAQNTHTVTVGPNGTFTFEPPDLTLNVGDTVLWVWDGIAGHSVSADSGAFQSAIVSAPNTFSVTFDAAFLAANPVAGDLYTYHCDPHRLAGMVGSIQVLPERVLSAPLVAGSTGTISVTGADPGNSILIGYSLTGNGPIPVVYGSLALSPPINQLPPQVADASGQVSLSVSIPAGLAGTTVHLHAAELFGGGGGILTNPVSVTL